MNTDERRSRNISMFICVYLYHNLAKTFCFGTFFWNRR
jgi:hypothetical protein